MEAPADDPGSLIFFQLGMIGVLTLVNAFFAAAEIALVSLDKKRMAHQAANGDRKARLLNKLLQDPGKFLATIQVGITLASLFSSASAATGLADQTASLLGNFPYAEELAIIMITLLLSYVTLVFGELFPKRIALQNAEKIARISVTPILLISKLALPFVLFLSFSTNLLAKITRTETVKVSGQTNARDEMKILAESGREDGSIRPAELDMIRGVFELNSKIAREIMTPRTDAFTLSADTPPDRLAPLLLRENYTRIPVYESDHDHIIGILNMKDYFHAAGESGFDHVDLRALLREPYFVPETRNIDDLLRDLQRAHQHIAVLLDEYGGFAGLVTLEDLIEEIVGEIEDEHDEAKGVIRQIDERTWLADGTLEIDAFNELFSTHIEAPNVDTLAGFVLSRMGYIPEKGHKPAVTYDHMLFTVESVRGNRLEKIRIEFHETLSEVSAS